MRRVSAGRGGILIQKKATSVAKLLRRQARRPFVLEITGTPKAGKTALISLVDTFLRDAGWRVRCRGSLDSNVLLRARNRLLERLRKT